jgi:hypothetical protein
MDENVRRVIPIGLFPRRSVFIIGATSYHGEITLQQSALPEMDLDPAPKKGTVPMVSRAKTIHRADDEAMIGALTSIEPPR